VASRAALGSLHPLQTISSPEHAAERLKGAWAAVEGMPRAVQAAEALAHDLGLRPFHIPSKAKPIYHASAVFASNYFVVVEAVAHACCGMRGCRTRRRGRRCARWWRGPSRT